MVQLAGKEVGPIGYGMMGLTTPRATPPTQEQIFEALRESLKHNANFWNAGEIYGTNERNSLHVINEYFTKYPEDKEKVVLSIKGAGVLGTHDFSSDEKNVARSVEECLRVIDGKKFIDIFECARVDPDVPIEDTIKQLAEYVKAGKIGGIGLSEASAESIRRAAKVHPIACVEVELSLWSTDIFKNGVAETCAELGIPLVGYAPLGKGFLTGQIKSIEDVAKNDPMLAYYPRFQPDVFEENIKIVKQIEEIATRKGCTPGQVAIAWARSHSDKPGMPTIIALPGANSPARIAENCKDVVLTEAEVKEIQTILDKFEAKGDRYPEHFMKQVHK